MEWFGNEIKWELFLQIIFILNLIIKDVLTSKRAAL